MNMCIPRQSWFYTSSARPTRQSNTAASPVATMEQLLTHTCAQKIILIWDCIFRSKQELKPGEELKRGFDLSTSAFHVKTNTHPHTQRHTRKRSKKTTEDDDGHHHNHRCHYSHRSVAPLPRLPSQTQAKYFIYTIDRHSHI